MSMTVQNIIDDVRPKLGDTVYPYQWVDSYFYTPINDGVRAIATQFPHALYISTVTTSLPADVSAVGNTVSVIDEFRNKLVDLVLAQLNQEDKQLQRQAAQQEQGEQAQ